MASRDPEDGTPFDPCLRQDSLWVELAREIRDRIRPPREPELQLESKPIAVRDIWSRPERRGATRWASIGIHAAVIGILMLPLWRPVRTSLRAALPETPLVLAPQSSPTPAPKHLAGGGALLARQPKLATPHVMALTPVTPPQLTIPMDTAVSPSSLFQAANVIGGPPGVGGGTSGSGSGGPGSGTGGGCVAEPCGNGLAGLSMPVPIYQPNPEYTDEARKAKFQGTVILYVMIGADGRVHDPKLVSGVGYGLDEKAVDTVKTWRFQPARRNGQPVEVAANVEVNFRLY